MITILSKWLIKDYQNYGDKKVRKAYGMLGSIAGIIFNVLLFLGKYIAGAISGSVSIMADAFNNLSDAGSSFITMIGFQFAGKKPDPDHPFGHGRFEYISGLVVALLIVLMGFELVKSSFAKILHPESMRVDVLTIVILLVSIGVKFYMSAYNKKIGKRIDSSAMKATATDSLSDCVATLFVLVSMVIYHFTKINVDGYCGMVVAFFILLAGYSAAKETLSPLLGEAPDKAFIEEVEQTVMAHDLIAGIHDMVVHDYGPGRVMISLHAEVPGNEDIFKLHDLIDQIEGELNHKFQCESVIHMDPIEVDNEVVVETRKKISALVKRLDEHLTIHDFRMVNGPTHTNVIFDVVVPLDFSYSDEEVAAMVCKKVQEQWDNYFAVIKVEKDYVGKN